MKAQHKLKKESKNIPGSYSVMNQKKNVVAESKTTDLN